MRALLAKFEAAGIAFTAMADGRLNSTGALTDELRAAIREQKAAILAELTAANEAATPAQASELRELIALILASGSEADKTEALAVALADPGAALTSFRALAADIRTSTRTHTPAREADDGRR